jgi:hypothetical protein
MGPKKRQRTLRGGAQAAAAPACDKVQTSAMLANNMDARQAPTRPSERKATA